MSFAPESEPLADPKALLHVPVGLVSPLWPLFAGAAMGGAAWWWMTRWAQPANLEAMFGAAAKTVEAAPEPMAFAAPAVAAVEAAEPALEAAEEAAIETVAETIEAVPAPILDALVEAPEVLEPVGGEAAPISPMLEAIAPEAIAPEAISAEAKPKARKKLAESLPDDASAAD